MKKYILTIAIVLWAYLSGAQITLEQTYTHTSSNLAQSVKFSATANGEKIVAYGNDTGYTFLKLYKSDYSLWKTITLPVIAGYRPWIPNLISDHLFNSDDSIELIANYGRIGTTGTPYRSFIISETGTIIKDLDSSVNQAIFFIDGVYKLVTSTYFGLAQYNRVYSLPGSIPCGRCGGLGVGKLDNSSGNGALSDPKPNPTTGTTTISYELPDNYNIADIVLYNINGSIVGVYPIQNGNSQIVINTSSFAPGVYYYTMRGSGIEIQAKKLLKID